VNGVLTYTPGPGFVGTDTMTYIADDGFQDSNPATITVTVGSPGNANNAPVAADDAYQTEVDSNLVIDVAGGVLANDVDADGDSLSVATHSQPAHGTLNLDADGSFEYKPAPGFKGTDSFTYVVADPTESGNTATVTITVDAKQSGGDPDPTPSPTPDDQGDGGQVDDGGQGDDGDQGDPGDQGGGPSGDDTGDDADGGPSGNGGDEVGGSDDGASESVTALPGTGTGSGQRSSAGEEFALATLLVLGGLSAAEALRRSIAAQRRRR
jgi:VCBS repeat-containing protein